ncbi:MAG: amidohydrolase family protein [Phycisphaerales bacterium]|nr:amidohydrolase family protein [Phycisphaerales bacterium]
MREAHAHILALGESLTIPSLAACASVAECLDAVRRAADRLPAGAWVRLKSARIESWAERRWPMLGELDRACGDRPCVIMSFDHHAAAGNTAALRAAGLAPGQRVEPNGEVCVDAASGRASGLLIEHAAYRAWASAPPESDSERRASVLAALRSLAALGYREVHDLHAQGWLGPMLACIERAGELPVERVQLYPNIAELPAVHAGRAAWESRAIRLAGGKVFADGTLNSRTALVLAPYREPFHGLACGRAMLPAAKLDAAIGLAESLGLHIAVHAIGDGAVRMVLDAFERTATPRAPGNRHRVEHAEIVDEADVPRFAGLGIVCSVQPCHLLADIEVLTGQFPDRLDRVLPLRELIDAGCKPGGDDALLWFGSDVPIVRADPGDSIQAAVYRRRAGQTAAEAIAPAQAITLDEARGALLIPVESR